MLSSRRGFLATLAALPGAALVSDAASRSEAAVLQKKESAARMSVTQSEWPHQVDGRAIQQFVLKNSHGLKVTVISYGAIVTAVETPDRHGKFDNITLAHPTQEGWLTNGPYFGAICGRFANRIAKGKFTIDGHEYSLATNNAPNALHGGLKGFDKKHWTAKAVEKDCAVGVELSLISRDGDEGYPGTLTSVVTYWLTEANELRIDYRATTDKATPVNLTNHCYWNLSGTSGRGTILDHELRLHCDRYLPVDDTLIPTGQLAPVADTPMDFRAAHRIGERIGNVEGGYDHCWVINDGGKKLTPAATVRDAKSGRVMTIATTEPGIQFYTGNFLDGSEASGGFPKNGAFCLEAEEFPDAPNQPSFPNSILKPGETYAQTTVHTFSVEK